MSGGELDYPHHRVEDVADLIVEHGTRPIHQAFANHLRKVANALHDLEWVWSGDYNPGDEDAAIHAVITPGDETDVAIAMARKACDELAKTLAQLAAQETT